MQPNQLGKKIKHLSVGFLVLLLATVGSSALAKTIITEVGVIFDKDDDQAIQLHIMGDGFGSAPIVNIGSYPEPLTVAKDEDCSPSDTECVIAQLPAGIPDGDYLLSLTNSDPSCADGKPEALTFTFIPADCDATNNDQDGKFECSDSLGPSGSDVTIELTKDANKITVSPDTEISSGDPVTFTATEHHLKASLEFDIKEGGETVQSLNIHTSCSKPLSVGDIFGSMELAEFIPDLSKPKKGEKSTENGAHYNLTIGATGGTQGPQGEQGDKGEKGDQGDQGDKGIQGIQGDKGDTGEQGPAGAPGAPGVSGYEIVSESKDKISFGNATVNASCPSPKVPLGGGCQALFEPSYQVVTTADYPFTSGEPGWVCKFTDQNKGTVPGTFTTYAICADALVTESQ